MEGIRRSRRSTRINSQNCGDSSSKNWYILVNEETKWEAREAFNKCRQQFNESIVQFKQRYDDRIAALRALAEHILDEPALAINFIHKLEMRRYHELRKDYENNLYDRVENLDAAYPLKDHVLFVRVLFVRVRRIEQVTVVQTEMTRTNLRTRSRTSIPSQRKGQKVRATYAS